MKRDKFKCTECGDKENMLQVHHKMYLNGKKVWEYPNELLVTLCKDCHSGKNEQKREFEELFFTQFYGKGFDYDDLQGLAECFYGYKPFIRKYLLIQTLKMVLSDNKLIENILNINYPKDFIDIKLEMYEKDRI